MRNQKCCVHERVATYLNVHSGPALEKASVQADLHRQTNQLLFSTVTKQQHNFVFFYFVLLLDCLELCLLDSQLKIPVLQGFVLFFCFMWWKKRACGWSNQNCKFNPSNLVNHYTTSSLVLSTHLVNCAVTC